MATKKRTSILIDERLLAKARRLLKARTNTEAITRALETSLANGEIAVSLRALVWRGRGRVVDVYR